MELNDQLKTIAALADAIKESATNTIDTLDYIMFTKQQIQASVNAIQHFLSQPVSE